MRAIPRPWGGPEWQRVLRNRDLALGPVAWVCVQENGGQFNMRFQYGEPVAIQAARLEVWPLAPFKLNP